MRLSPKSVPVTTKPNAEATDDGSSTPNMRKKLRRDILYLMTLLCRDQKLHTCKASWSKPGSPDRTYRRPPRVMPALSLVSEETIAELTWPESFSMQ